VWKLRKQVMGDAIGMGVVHALSGIAWQMQANGARPVAVYATSAPTTVRGFETDPIWNILIRFDTGATAFSFGNIDVSNGYDAYHNLSGTEGGFIFDSQTDRAGKVRLWSKRTTAGKWAFPLDAERCRRDSMAASAWPADMALPDSGDVVHHQTAEAVGHFIDCIQQDRRSPLSFTSASLIGELGWAARLSAATGREVPLPLDRAQAARVLG
jgi:predicted dehydrogenase